MISELKAQMRDWISNGGNYSKTGEKKAINLSPDAGKIGRFSVAVLVFHR